MKKFVLMAVGLMLLMAPAAKATTFSLEGQKYDSVAALVDFNYHYDSLRSLGIVDINIANNTVGNGVLTSFAFNLPDDIRRLGGFTSSLAGWQPRLRDDRINGGNAGKFDIAGMSGSNFLRGDVHDGLLPGESALFSFQLIGTGLDSLATSDFLGLDSLADDGSSTYFVARFQGVGNRGNHSDLATPAPVPEPGTVSLLASGLIFFGAITLRRKHYAHRLQT